MRLNVNLYENRIGNDASRGRPSMADVESAVLDGIKHMESIQWEKGCVVGEVVWCPMLTAQYVMTAYMTERRIPEERKERFKKHFDAWRLEDGSWGMHAESPGYVFVTTLVYIALRIMGVDAEDPRCTKAKEWIDDHGGVLAIPSWGKAWLAMMNLYSWKGVTAMIPELWLQPDSSPFHPRRMYCHTRMIYLGLSYLFGVKFQMEENAFIRELRKELYHGPFKSIDFPAHKYDLADSDVFEYPHPILKAAYEVCGAYDERHPKPIRRLALDRCLQHIEHHQRDSRFAAISPVNGLLNTLALYHAEHPDFEESFKGVDYWSWSDEEEGERFNGAHSHTWDTAFTVQGVCEGPFADKASKLLRNAARYFKNAQMTEEVDERERFYRDQRRGGFCFSDEHHRWPVSDCAAEALSALAHLESHVSRQMLPGPEMLAEAVRFILTRQNPDGGWGSYERRRGGMFLEMLNPSEMFGNCMVEHSYVECTASCMVALKHGLDKFGGYLSENEIRKVEKAIRRGAKLLEKTQTKEGCWPGFWGVNYVYGTLFGVMGLLASGTPATDKKIRRACDWLLSVRLPDGGWGESYRGCVEERYIPHEQSQVIMTSWALMALLKAGAYEGKARRAIDEAAALLISRQEEDGSWPKEGVGGVFFNTAMHHYCLYKDEFTIWALGLYAKQQM